jgi:hypothetical protein
MPLAMTVWFSLCPGQIIAPALSAVTPSMALRE